jgi:hypothetical protein
MISLSPYTRAAHSRHDSPSDFAHVHNETNVVTKPNTYEQEGEKRKNALHDSVQLALIESGFEEAAQLRAAFTREDTSMTISCATPSRSRQLQKRVPEGHGE